jgi:hypothetical protein
VLAGILVATACSAGSKPSAAKPIPSAAPATSSTSSAGSRASGSSCGSQPASGAQGGGDVLVPGDIPDNQAYVVYLSTADGYHLSVPEGWARSEAGGTVTFSDKFNSIQVQVVAAPSAPSVAAAQSTEVAALAASFPCFQAGKVSQVARRSGPAVLITYRADSPSDPVTGKVVRQDVERYEFWRAGKTAVITLASAQGSDNVDPWRRVTDSFTWLA